MRYVSMGKFYGMNSRNRRKVEERRREKEKRRRVCESKSERGGEGRDIEEIRL
ncbi:hypothetical protein HRbin04_00147 [archaeon HR04]|nr:hypothetical protein HRbin04_00147 [archaeon HR04]